MQCIELWCRYYADDDGSLSPNCGLRISFMMKIYNLNFEILDRQNIQYNYCHRDDKMYSHII